MSDNTFLVDCIFNYLWNVPADKEGFKQYIKEAIREWYFEK